MAHGQHRPELHMSGVTSVLTLAKWRWRQHWFLLLVTELGMVAAVMLVCAVPLLTTVMQTAGLRGVLAAGPTSAQITLRTTMSGLSTSGANNVFSRVSPPFQQYLSPYLSGPPRLDVQTPGFPLLSPRPLESGDRLYIYGTSMAAAASHIERIQGRLPRASSQNVEVAITRKMASLLHINVGSMITLDMYVYPLPAAVSVASVHPLQPIPLHFSMQVVGLIATAEDDAFWNGIDFLPRETLAGLNFTVLTSGQNLLASFETLAAKVGAAGQAFFADPSYLYWYYRLNPSRMTINQLDILMQQLAHTQAYMTDHFSDPYMIYHQPYLQKVALSGAVLHEVGLPSSLERFRSHIAVARIPTGLLTLQILSLLLLFISVMAALLVERQANAMHMLRSRGARLFQVLGSLMTQSLGLGLLALLFGPLLAIPAIYLLSRQLLPPTLQNAFNVISNAPVQALLAVKWYALGGVGLSIVTMVLALYRASRLNILGGRAAITGRRPLLRRLNLDIVAALIALVGYGVSLYLSSIEQLLDAQAQALVSPLQLVAPVFLLLAAVLLFLRLFPWLLQLGSGLAMRGRGAAPMLALAQIARAPRQSVRMTLLLALAVAFAIFTLVFAASQAQRAQDIASSIVGADFSGDIPVNAPITSLQVATARYRHIPGVLAASVGALEQGSVVEGTSATSASLPLQIRAVDPTTFAATIIWPRQDAQQVSSLLEQLLAQRGAAVAHNLVPVIVDAATWDTLALHDGAIFPLRVGAGPGDTVRAEVVAEVALLPTVSADSAGILVDYTAFAAAQAKNGINAQFNHVWLHTRDDAAALAHMRAALTHGESLLENLSDRRLLVQSLQNDPLALTLLGLLEVGATTALLLALVGNLLTSWLSVRLRLTNFAVLRALGTSPGEIAGVLLWEQSIVYAVSLLMGCLFGAWLALTVIPALIFSSVSPDSITGTISDNEFFALQHVFPPQLVVPFSLLIALIVLALICTAAIGLMARVVLQPALGRVLRISEDGSSDLASTDEVAIIRGKARASISARRRQSQMPSLFTLAFWRARQTKFLLLVTCVGMLAAVTLVCAIPLFTQVTMTAGVRSVLTASPTSAEVTLAVTTQGLSSRAAQSVQRRFEPSFQRYLGPYMSQPAQLSISLGGFTPVSPRLSKGNTVQLESVDMDTIAAHLSLVQGRLPQTYSESGNSAIMEVLLTPETAQRLHAGVGSLLTLHGDFFLQPSQMFGGTSPTGTFTMRVAGLFALSPDDVPFWHGENFQPVQQSGGSMYTLLIPNESLVNALNRLAAASPAGVVFSPQTYTLRWDYNIDPARLTIDQLNDLINRLNGLQAAIASISTSVQDTVSGSSVLPYPYLTQVNLYNPAPGAYELPVRLDAYRNRAAVLNVPVAILSLQILALLLFFVSLVANLLVERQAEAIAMLRSRGASNYQIFGSLFAQSIGLGLVALIAGPVLAVAIVATILSRLLARGEQDTIGMITRQPILTALGVGGYALATVLVTMAVVVFLLLRAADMNVLSWRRETARTTQPPFWQRANLDIIAALLALTAYAVSLYLTNLGGLLDTRTRVLISAPLALAAPIFLLLSCVILFLRFFPALLRFASSLAVRNRGAVSLLALAQTSRAPRQTVRMTLLLALATAFAIFILVFTASQYQRAADIAAYEAGADFSGDIPVSTRYIPLQEETAKYSAIPGVFSATAGFSASGLVAESVPIPVQVLAVNSDTFAQTALWTPQDSPQSLSSLMALLSIQRKGAINDLVVPAIVDANLADQLDLSIGSAFTANVNGLASSTLNCRVLAIVQHIPTINDSTGGNIEDYSPPAGILVDYATYAGVYQRDLLMNGLSGNSFLPLNYVWLRTKSDPVALAHVRAALATSALHLNNLYDRRALTDALRTDPLYLDLLAILTIGAMTALLLSLVGDLIASWLNVRTRLTNFAVLRALGATPRQVASLLTWEQGVVYSTALLLGCLLGWWLSFTLVPTLVFTNLPTSGAMSTMGSDEFYTLQQIIAPHIVVPASLDIIFVLLVLICLIALGMMARVVLRPSMSQTLRLNED